MNSPQQVVLHSQSPLPNVQQNIRQGDLLFVRVMKNLGGGNYLASFAGGRFTVKSAADLIAGQTFRARVEIAGGKLLLVPQAGGTNGANQNAAISVQNFNALSPEVAAFLTSMGLEADGVAQRILQFLMQSGAKINPSLMQKARRLASKYKGHEAEAAEAALILEQKGIDAEDALDEIMSLLGGGSEKNKGREKGEVEGRSSEKGGVEVEGRSRREKEESREQQDLSSEVEVTSLDKVLDEFNKLPQKNTDFPNKSWLLVPFEFNIGSLKSAPLAALHGTKAPDNLEAPNLADSLFPSSVPFSLPEPTGSGILRLFIDTEKNITEKFAINFEFSGKNLFFAVYYNNKKAEKICFSGEGLDLNSAELKAGLNELGDSLGEGVQVEIVPFEEFSSFATENLPLSAVEGFA